MSDKGFRLSRLLLVASLLCFPSFEASSELSNQGTVNFEISDQATPPVDPREPEKEVEIEGPILATKGNLRFDYIPHLSFGLQKASNQDAEYYADPVLLGNNQGVRANFLQVTDHRETASGWQVTVKQETEFLSEKTQQPLKGAYLSFDNQWTNSTTESLGAPTISKETIKITEVGANYPVAKATAGTGTGTWTISFGSANEQNPIKNTFVPRSLTEKKLGTSLTTEKNSSIRLFVPGAAEKMAENYTTVLTWTLSEI